jgi:Transglycosylase-like domain
MSYRKTFATLAAIAAGGALAAPAMASPSHNQVVSGHNISAAPQGGATGQAGGGSGQAGGSSASPQLQAIAQCESGGDPGAIGGGGTYRGKYQFTYETWASVGGSGDPAAAPESEQDQRAAALLAQSGSSPWPVCG